MANRLSSKKISNERSREEDLNLHPKLSVTQIPRSKAQEYTPKPLLSKHAGQAIPEIELFQSEAIILEDSKEHESPIMNTNSTQNGFRLTGDLLVFDSPVNFADDPKHKGKPDYEAMSNFTGYGVEHFRVDKVTGKQMHMAESRGNKRKYFNCVRAIYGKRGFLQFLENVLILLNVKDRNYINFYFTIKDHILDHCDRVSRGQFGGEEEKACGPKPNHHTNTEIWMEQESSMFNQIRQRKMSGNEKAVTSRGVADSVDHFQAPGENSP